MTTDELLKALARLRVETGSLACFGCGREHNCSTKGCAILRAAADLIERLKKEKATLLEYVKKSAGCEQCKHDDDPSCYAVACVFCEEDCPCKNCKDVPEGNRILDKMPSELFHVHKNERGATYHLTRAGLNWLGRRLKMTIMEAK